MIKLCRKMQNKFKVEDVYMKEKILRVIRYVISIFIYLMALVCFSNKWLLSGIILVLSGTILLPILDDLLKFKHKSLIEVLATIILFIFGMAIAPASKEGYNNAISENALLNTNEIVNDTNSVENYIENSTIENIEENTIQNTNIDDSKSTQIPTSTSNSDSNSNKQSVGNNNSQSKAQSETQTQTQTQTQTTTTGQTEQKQTKTESAQPTSTTSSSTQKSSETANPQVK